MTARDRYRIALNIAAQIGLDHPMFISEYSKAIAQTHIIDSQKNYQQPMMPQAQAQPTQPTQQTPPPMFNNQTGGEIPQNSI